MTERKRKRERKRGEKVGEGRGETEGGEEELRGLWWVELSNRLMAAHQ